MIAALLLAVAAAQPAGGEGWHVAIAGESAQFGVPGTDERALRIDCRPGYGLRIIGPAASAPDENQPIQVTFRRGDTSVTLLGVTIMLGEGLSFAVPVQAGELPIAALVAGEALTVAHGGESWVVPGEGAAAAVGPLVAGCSVSRR